MYPSLQRFPGELFVELDQLQLQMERLLGPSGRSSSIRAVERGSFPAINIGVTPESVDIYAFAPGLDMNSLDVTVDKGLLTIAGRRNPESSNAQADSKTSVYARERVFGDFRRVVSLPEDADPERTEASYRDGVLRVRLQKREASRPRRIEVKDAQ
jgi:HSP20 family protein